jgi:hypothetical protein
MKKQSTLKKANDSAKIKTDGTNLGLEKPARAIKSRLVTKLVTVDMYLVKALGPGFKFKSK